ncbi:LysR family transcriptional regulator [Mesorhizobium sp. B2-3-3]|uniref:LysR substrate-binding domain-containing protein n=1 Tax=Mesorhizobium sp. B2-3-5 TaxID=2589958 RepID=UPI00112AFD79|nr:LysR substrate-binding domain-containing protein [Mesorhizobium sp. B2-3-5]TPM22523.1 LysR family transcriptional regulator [Mesorhizobium sp. B2-3-5]TPN22296.1 LysR family transcriptional regulator [Mesorhizobium sp. B2-3-3]
MHNELLHLSSLRAFFSVAKLGGIPGAARDLNVTPGAVRHHIRTLEEQLGTQLVVRSRKEFSLTASGAAFFAKLSRAFEEIQSACRTAASDSFEGELHVSCAPGLAALRLMGILDRFADRFPLVTVRLFPIEQASEAMDVVISYGERPIHGSRYAILKNERYFAVCSPNLFYRNALRSPADLQNHVLLHSDDGEDWQRLIRTSAAGQILPRQHMYFPNAYLTLQGAREDCGVAVGSSILCAEDLRRGSLIKVLDLEIPAPYPYFVIQPSETKRPIAEVFSAILVEQLENIG